MTPEVARILAGSPGGVVQVGDCLDVMVSMPPAGAKLVFIDPPYNEGISYGNGFDDSRPRHIFLDWLTRRLTFASRHAASDGSLWLLVPDEIAAECKVHLSAQGMHLINWIKFHETFGVYRHRLYGRCCRHLFWFSWDPSTRLVDPDDPLVRVPSARAEKYNDARAAGGGLKIAEDVWTFSRVAGTFRERVEGSRTQLPLALLRRVVASCTRPGDLVLDPFCGSGTALAAAVGMGRRAIGIDIGADHAERARARIAEAQEGARVAEAAPGPVGA